MEQQSQPQGIDSERTAQPKPQTGNGPEAGGRQAYEELYLRFRFAIRELADEAVEQRKPRAFLEAVAWEVSRLIDGYGLVAAGDFLQILGNMVQGRADLRRAQAEATAARKEGHQPS